MKLQMSGQTRGQRYNIAAKLSEQRPSKRAGLTLQSYKAHAAFSKVAL